MPGLDEGAGVEVFVRVSAASGQQAASSRRSRGISPYLTAPDIAPAGVAAIRILWTGKPIVNVYRAEVGVAGVGHAFGIVWERFTLSSPRRPSATCKVATQLRYFM